MIPFPTTAELTEKNARIAEAVAKAKEDFVPTFTEAASEWFQWHIYESVRATSNPENQ